MAGVGFELRKAIKKDAPLRSAGGYISAAFTSGGTILIGIIIVCFIQAAAKFAGVSSEISDQFMCYVTQTMFCSMLTTSLVTMPISRFVADQMYLKKEGKIMPSFISASACTTLAGTAIFVVLMFLSKLPLTDIGFLIFLYIVLVNCWLLMSYISLIRRYKKITLAYITALGVSVCFIAVFFFSKSLSLYSMLSILVLSYTCVDAILFAALYQRFPIQDSFVDYSFKRFYKSPILSIIGFCCMLGMLGHFVIDWFFSSSATTLYGLFRFDDTYDFPAILAYCSTIPAMCYFVTFFETMFERKYTAYFHSLGNGGKLDEIEKRHHSMVQTLYTCLRSLFVIQIIGCILFITVIAQLLSIMNIGMTTDMLNSFRIFCVGYSFYEVGNVLILLNLYFLNDKKAAITSVAFMLISLLGTILAIKTNIDGIGLLAASIILVAASAAQLAKCLEKLEEHILLRQPIKVSVEKGESMTGKTIAERILSNTNRLERRITQFACAMLAAAIFLSVAQVKEWKKQSLIHTYYPEVSDAILVSPGMGFAPWANSPQTLELETSLVYVELVWADWEPEDGIYNVDWVNEEYNLDIYRSEGRNVVLRFICDEPTDDEHCDIPDWLYEQIEGDGQWYDTSYGKGFSPNYENETLIKYHSRAIAALGAAFGEDDFVMYVEFGSLGHWGEWHTNAEEGMSGMPVSSIREQYVMPYLSAFPNASFLLRYPLVEVKKFGTGLYNDMTGDFEETVYWLEQMESGGIWEQSGAEEQAICVDTWKTKPIGGEFASSHENDFFLNQELSTTLEILKNSHQSFIGPKIIIDESDVNYDNAVSQILTSIGYRYYVSSVKIDLSKTETMNVTCTFNNCGIAPIYKHYDVVFSLCDEDGSVVATFDDNELELQEVLPDEEKSVSFTADISDLDDDVKYTLCVAVENKDGEAYIPLALAKEISPLVYELATFGLE